VDNGPTWELDAGTPARRQSMRISKVNTKFSKQNGASSVLQKRPREVTIRLTVSGAQRVPVRIDCDHAASQAFNLQGLLKAGLSVEPDERVR